MVGDTDIVGLRLWLLLCRWSCWRGIVIAVIGMIVIIDQSGFRVHPDSSSTNTAIRTSQHGNSVGLSSNHIFRRNSDLYILSRSGVGRTSDSHNSGAGVDREFLIRSDVVWDGDTEYVRRRSSIPRDGVGAGLGYRACCCL